MAYKILFWAIFNPQKVIIANVNLTNKIFSLNFGQNGFI
jgi:hypothetical protein